MGLLALAVGKGKVSLDGTVDRYLPSAKDSAWGKRQIWQLVSARLGRVGYPQGLIEQRYGDLLNLLAMDLAEWILGRWQGGERRARGALRT